MNREKLEKAFCEYKNGNEDAFQQLYNESIIFIKNIIFSMLKNKEDCEDILQDIFLKIFMIDKENLPNKNWIGWLYVVTKNVCKDALKRKRIMQDFNVLYDYTVECNEMIKQEEVEFCSQILEELNKNEKDIVWLKIIYNFTFKEIAYKMKLPISTVSWTYYNAIMKLKEKFNK